MNQPQFLSKGWLTETVAPAAFEALIIFVCVALVVAISRIYLKKHNRLDVFIGFVIGLIAGYVAKIILIHL